MAECSICRVTIWLHHSVICEETQDFDKEPASVGAASQMLSLFCKPRLVRETSEMSRVTRPSTASGQLHSMR